MNIREAKKRINDLKEKLNKWREAYYVLDDPIVDDSVYDESYRELVNIESNFPELITSNSPTQQVGDMISSTFDKIDHEIPMLSLDNAFNESDLLTFNRQVTDIEKEIDYYVEPKIDGISISIKYRDGKLYQAVTRGDGITGEDVTESIKKLSTVPLTINEKTWLEIRGEVYIPWDKFLKLNKQREEDGETLFANPRNTAAGSVRQLDPTIAKKRGLSLLSYSVYNLETKEYFLDKQSETFVWLKDNKFKISPEAKLFNSIEEVNGLIEWFGTNRHNLNYEIDGVVIKVNNTKLYEKIGYTSKFPKWAIAYKFPAEVKETKLLNVFPTIGRTGRVTYNATLEEVELAGTKVSAATLHNAEYIIELDLRINDIVRVKKAGEIIPKVVSVNMDKRDGSQLEWKIEKNCPSCNQELIKKEFEVDQYCINEFCPSRITESIIHFVSRDAMNIDGLSIKQIEKFINLKWIKDVSDIYDLHKYEKELYELEGYKEKSINNLLTSIEKSKDTTLNRLLFGLGIRYIGKKTAKDLAMSFSSIADLKNVTYEKFLEQNVIGEVRSKSLVTYFENEKNNKLIESLISKGVNPKPIKLEIDSNNRFFEKTIVITGTIEGGTREEVKNFFEEKGAKVTSSISSKTDFLICGINPSKNKVQKMEKDKIINIENILDYKE